jgi:hypothetical protein
MFFIVNCIGITLSIWQSELESLPATLCHDLHGCFYQPSFLITDSSCGILQVFLTRVELKPLIPLKRHQLCESLMNAPWVRKTPRGAR